MYTITIVETKMEVTAQTTHCAPGSAGDTIEKQETLVSREIYHQTVKQVALPDLIATINRYNA